MTITVSTLTAWRPWGLNELATALRTEKQALQSLEDEMTLGRPSTEWVGTDALAARAQHRRLYDDAVDLTAEISTVAEALEEACASILDAQARLTTTRRMAEDLNFHIHDDGSVTWLGTDLTNYVDPSGATVHLRATVLAMDVDKSLGSAVQADEALAAVLENVALGYYDAGGTLTTPGVASPLEALLALSAPTAEQVQVIRALLLPEVDEGSAADAFLDCARRATHGGHLDLRNQLSVEFATTVVGFARYAGWARKHPEVAVPLTAGQRAWLAAVTSRFYPDTLTGNGPVRNDYRRALGISDEALANSLLVLSNEDLGGGYDQLPESVRAAAEEDPSHLRGPVVWANDEFMNLARILVAGDLVPGDGLTKVLAGTLASTVRAEEQTRALGRTEEDFTSRRNLADPKAHAGHFDDAAMSGLLEVISRNRDATADLFTGEGMPVSHDRAEFVRNLYTHDWDDDGRGLTSLTDWMHTDRETPADRERADSAFAAMVKSMTSTGPTDFANQMQVHWQVNIDDGSAFADLMGDGGASATQMNPAATRSLVIALSDHLGEFETGTSTMLDESDQVRFLTLLASDEENNHLLAATFEARQLDNIDTWLSGDANRMSSNVLGANNARLASMLDSALFNVAAEADLDVGKQIDDHLAALQETKASRDEIAQDVKALLEKVVPIGPILETGNAALEVLIDHSEQITVEPREHFAGPANVVRSWSSDGSHVLIAHGEHMLTRLIESGDIDLARLVDEGDSGALRAHQLDILLDPNGLKTGSERPSDVALKTAQRVALDSVLTGQDTFADYQESAGKQYWKGQESWNMRVSGGRRLEEFLHSRNWLVEGNE